MFNKLKMFVSGVGLVFKYGDLASGIVKAWNSFPGLDADGATLRRWLKSLLLDASVLALLTKTEFDDNIVIGALRLVDDDRAWSIIHSLALLARDGELAVPSRTELPLERNNPLPLGAGINERNNVERMTEGEADCGEAARFPESEEYPNLIAELNAASQEALPDCPTLIHAAVGLLLFLLQQRFSKA